MFLQELEAIVAPEDLIAHHESRHANHAQACRFLPVFLQSREMGEIIERAAYRVDAEADVGRHAFQYFGQTNVLALGPFAPHHAFDIARQQACFLGGEGHGANKLEAMVFARANRLLAKYGRTYAAGETLIEEGDTAKDAYFLYAGQVAVYKRFPDGEKHLTDMEEGNLMGEMAYLLNEVRTASVRAKTEVTALVLPPELLEELMRYSAPLSRRIIGALAQRLMRMNQSAAG